MVDGPGLQFGKSHLPCRIRQSCRAGAVMRGPYARIFRDALHAAAPTCLPRPSDATKLPEFPQPVGRRLIDGHLRVTSACRLGIVRNWNRPPLLNKAGIGVTGFMAVPLSNGLQLGTGANGINWAAEGRCVDAHSSIVSVKLA